ncbi:hypothetical protein HELRODRAFT_191752 [Helobdella robusta]|uniref:Uncharacterized protein n=1 Tax=Helobdella robusta TaxID=6412 RepID=T1FT98_HELRO|nr:hypothetical protein HELRODRAFT_191752 [Helobdella robusta]ESO04225.1 hypothetical protein HELRODRAFT_191752 [Helobdella robusta]
MTWLFFILVLLVSIGFGLLAAILFRCSEECEIYTSGSLRSPRLRLETFRWYAVGPPRPPTYSQSELNAVHENRCDRIEGRPSLDTVGRTTLNQRARSEGDLDLGPVRNPAAQLARNSIQSSSGSVADRYQTNRDRSEQQETISGERNDFRVLPPYSPPPSYHGSSYAIRVHDDSSDDDYSHRRRPLFRLRCPLCCPAWCERSSTLYILESHPPRSQPRQTTGPEHHSHL